MGGDDCRAESEVLGRVHMDRQPGVDDFFGLFLRRKVKNTDSY